MTISFPVDLFQVSTGAAVEAVVYRGVPVSKLLTVTQIWHDAFDKLRRDALLRGVPLVSLPVHAHWDWGRKERVTRQQALFSAVECEQEIQGLMMMTFHKTCRLLPQHGQGMVYIDYIESAPWNVEPLTDTPLYRAVGSVLLEQAILISEERGFEGRIGLHSLQQAERFYANKMTDMGIDPAVEFLRYFEMTPQQAARFTGG